MSIKYIVKPESGKTIAILKNTRYDAVKRISKLCKPFGIQSAYCFLSDDIFNKLLMPDKFKAVVTCHPDDVFVEQEGKSRSKEKLMNKYYASLDKRVDIFFDMLHKCANNGK